MTEIVDGDIHSPDMLESTSNPMKIALENTTKAKKMSKNG